jgi:hypothetical protein
MDRDGAAARFGGFLLLCAILLALTCVFFIPPPNLPTSFANGVYYSACCGSVRLSNGIGTVKSGSFKYVIEKDKEGPYILPTDHAVVANSEDIIIADRKAEFFIRTDGSTPPQWIYILGPQAEHKFMRQQ